MTSSRMAHLRSTTMGLAALAGVIALSGEARAQYAFDPGLPLPPRAVVWRLNDRGFTEVGRPRFDGRAYVVEATGPYGDRVRLFVDAGDGAVLGRQRLDVPERPVAMRLVRPAPGYGWTEEDAQPRRWSREAEGLLPPASIPGAAGPARPPRFDSSGASGPNRQPRFDIAGRPDAAPWPEPADRNPLGMNPDARNPDSKGRAEPAPRKAARLTPPAKPPALRLAPEAPRPSDVAKQAAPPVSAPPEPPVASIEPPKVPPVTTPAAVQPPPVVAQGATDAPAKAQTWKDPPAEPRKAVRVIGGATIVPGAGDKDQGAPDKPAE